MFCSPSCASVEFARRGFSARGGLVNRDHVVVDKGHIRPESQIVVSLKPVLAAIERGAQGKLLELRSS